jgi:hypothetical protein
MASTSLADMASAAKTIQATNEAEAKGARRGQ